MTISFTQCHLNCYSLHSASPKALLWALNLREFRIQWTSGEWYFSLTTITITLLGTWSHALEPSEPKTRGRREALGGWAGTGATTLRRCQLSGCQGGYDFIPMRQLLLGENSKQKPANCKAVLCTAVTKHFVKKPLLPLPGSKSELPNNATIEGKQILLSSHLSSSWHISYLQKDLDKHKQALTDKIALRSALILYAR